MSSEILSHDMLLQYFGLDPNTISFENKSRIITTLSKTGNTLRAIMLKEDPEVFKHCLESNLKMSKDESGAVFTRIVDDMSSYPKQLPALDPSIASLFPSEPKEEKDEKKKKSHSDSDSSSFISSSESDSDSSSSSPSSKKLIPMKKGKILYTFLAYSNPYCSLSSPTVCQWTGYQTMRVLSKSLSKGKYQVIFSFNERCLSSESTCIGICKDPWSSMNSDSTFGNTSLSIAYKKSGKLMANYTALFGNDPWIISKDSKIYVGMEVDLKKDPHKSIACYILNGKVQNVYHSGIAVPCLFGVSGGSSGAIVELLKFIKIQKLHFKAKKGTISQTWNFS